MATYHINLRTGSRISDTLEVEHDDDEALRVEVARFVGETLRDHAAQIWFDEDWRVDVCDHRGLILYVLNISVTASPALSPIKQ